MPLAAIVKDAEWDAILDQIVDFKTQLQKLEYRDKDRTMRSLLDGGEE